MTFDREREQRILLRDKYHCTEQVVHRVTGELVRCPRMGSEMAVANDRAMCPKHALEWHEAQSLR